MLWTNAWTTKVTCMNSFIDAGIGVYITTRPHIVPHLTEEFQVAAVERIRADPEDIRRFLEQAIERHSRRDRVGSELKKTILTQIGDAQGMYETTWLTTLDFSLPASKSSISFEPRVNIT